MNDNKTYLIFTSVDSMGKKYQVSVDDSGNCHIQLERAGDKNLNIHKEIDKKAFLSIFKEFYNALTLQENSVIDMKPIDSGFWFFQLFVAGVPIVYQTGPITDSVNSPYKNLDELIQRKFNAKPIFTKKSL